MRICMFTNTYLPHVGGVARSVAAFSEDLRKLGHEVLVAAPVYEDEDAEPDDESQVLRLKAIQNFNGSDFSLRLPEPFVIDDKLDEFDPHLIHSHHPYLLGDTALRAARQEACPWSSPITPCTKTTPTTCPWIRKGYGASSSGCQLSTPICAPGSSPPAGAWPS